MSKTFFISAFHRVSAPILSPRTQHLPQSLYFGALRAMSTHKNVPRIRKRLIICCDGTWQSSVSGVENIPSNVTRLCRHIEKDKVVVDDDGQMWQQMVFYDPGIGTGDLSIWDTALQGATGLGLARNVFEAYNFLALNYQPPDPEIEGDTGDKIYCFGFSRGAYTARALSGFIAALGICSPLDMQALPHIYNMYEKAAPYNKDGESRRAKASRENLWGEGWTEGDPKKGSIAWKWLNGQPIPVVLGDPKLGTQMSYMSEHRNPISPYSHSIEVVGVWDTVGSLGIPKVFGLIKPTILSLFTDFDKPGREFHDVHLSPNVKWAFHAMALDEQRAAFTPTLWSVPKDTQRDEGTLKQVWFPGCHVNIGGGSDDILEGRRSDFEGIANITFAWMVEQLRNHLAFNEPSFIAAIEDRRKLLSTIDKTPLPWPKSLFWRALAAPRRVWRFLMAKAAKVHIPAPGWATGRIEKWPNDSLVMFFGGHTIRRPGETSAPVSKGAKAKIQPLAELGGDTCEMIHPCVWTRIQTTKFWPPALQGWRRERLPPPSPHAIQQQEHHHSHSHSNKSSCDGWVWRKNDLTIPEYSVARGGTLSPHATERNLERLIVEASGLPASKYLAMLDKVLYEGGEDETAVASMQGMRIGVYSKPDE